MPRACRPCSASAASPSPLRGDAVRVAPSVYNEPADVDALLDALRTAAA